MTRRTFITVMLIMLPAVLAGCGGDDPTKPPAEKKPAPDALVGVWVATGEWDPLTRSRIYAASESLADSTLGFVFGADQTFTARTDYIIGEPSAPWTDLSGIWGQQENGEVFGACELTGKWVEYTFTVHEADGGDLIMHTLRAWYIELMTPDPLPIR